MLGCTDGKLIGLEIWVVRQVALTGEAADCWTAEDV